MATGHDIKKPDTNTDKPASKKTTKKKAAKKKTTKKKTTKKKAPKRPSRRIRKSYVPLDFERRSFLSEPLTDREFRQAERLAGFGMKSDQIGIVLGFNREMWGDYVANEPLLKEIMERGRMVGAANIAESLVNMATSGEHPSVTIFASKVMLGYKESPQAVAVFNQQIVAANEENKNKIQIEFIGSDDSDVIDVEAGG